MWSDYCSGSFLIWKIKTTPQLIFRGNKIQFQGHVDFKLPACHLREIRHLQRKCETCLLIAVNLDMKNKDGQSCRSRQMRTRRHWSPSPGKWSEASITSTPAPDLQTENPHFSETPGCGWTFKFGRHCCDRNNTHVFVNYLRLAINPTCIHTIP